MPTLPIGEILSRSISDDKLRERLGAAASVVEEAVARSTHVIGICSDATGLSYSAAPAILLLGHAAALADAVPILLKRSAVDACKPLLRGMLEVLFSVHYMLKDDTSRRSAAFFGWQLRERLRQHRQLDSSREEGVQFRAHLGKDSFLAGAVIPAARGDPDAIHDYEEMLRRPPFALIEGEYQRLRKKKGNRPDWYSCFDGPGTVRELAKQAGFEGLYETYYRSWSSTAHGTDIAGRISADDSGVIKLAPLRRSRDAGLVAFWAALLLAEIGRVMLIQFAPEAAASHRDWWLQEMAGRIGGLPKMT